jgi:hypothetical protein
MRARVQGLDGEWNRVSGSEPCPICGGPSECKLHSEESFACCVREPSDWRLENGGWLHRVQTQSRNSDVLFVQPAPEPRATSVRSTGVAS